MFLVVSEEMSKVAAATAISGPGTPKLTINVDSPKAVAVAAISGQGSPMLTINIDSPFIFSFWSKTFDFPLVVGLVNDPLANTDTVTVF